MVALFCFILHVSHNLLGNAGHPQLVENNSKHANLVKSKLSLQFLFV